MPMYYINYSQKN